MIYIQVEQVLQKIIQMLQILQSLNDNTPLIRSFYKPVTALRFHFGRGYNYYIINILTTFFIFLCLFLVRFLSKNKKGLLQQF